MRVRVCVMLIVLFYCAQKAKELAGAKAAEERAAAQRILVEEVRGVDFFMLINLTSENVLLRFFTSWYCGSVLRVFVEYVLSS